jgi:hypothetical protein
VIGLSGVFGSLLLQGFITDNDEALELLFGESNEGTRKFDKCIETIATRLSTVFASMKVKQIMIVCLNSLSFL